MLMNNEDVVMNTERLIFTGNKIIYPRTRGIVKGRLPNLREEMLYVLFDGEEDPLLVSEKELDVYFEE